MTPATTLGVVSLLAFIFISNYLVQVIGTSFYKHQEHLQLFDMVHHLTPDLHEYKIYNHIIVLTVASSFFFLSDPIPILIEFSAKFLLIMVLRAITTLSTILPKYSKCDPKLSFVHYLKGNCYDKVFSGHTAFVFLATLIFQREQIISFPFFALINVLNTISILLTRSHYTLDVIIAYIITYLVYDGDYHIFTDFFNDFYKSFSK
jgi:PAP2 superfamily C-terminal